MTTIDSMRLKQSYLAAGGTEDDWNAAKADLIEAARRQQAITETLKEANRPPSVNDLIRHELNERRNDDLLERLIPTQKGTAR